MSEIIAVFLIQFDVKVGYKLVWSKSKFDISLDGIEFKCLPSGIHEFHEDLIPFTHIINDEIYYGVSKFRSNMESDRDLVKMFSIGVLCKSKESDWKPNDFISNGFEYISYLDDLLLDYLQGVDHITNLEIANIQPKKFISPLLSLPLLFNRFGPLIFKIFKLSLLRKRILIVNKLKAHNYELSIFTYLISILSLIPAMKITVNHPQYTQPLYNIGLNDIGRLPNNYIAVTNDEIMIQQPIYDYAIIIDDTPSIVTYQSVQSKSSKHLKATYNDYLKFKIIYDNLKDDNITFNSSSSLVSDIDDNKWSYETTWWDNVTPISWTQYIWSAFSWFASAGQINIDDRVDRDLLPQINAPDCPNHNLPQIHHRNSFNSQLSQISMFEGDGLQFIDIIGYFHKLTKKWIYLINEIVVDELYHGEIEINYSDLIDLELDPYSDGDIEFLKQFIGVYWDVDHVEISSGLKFFC